MEYFEETILMDPGSSEPMEIPVQIIGAKGITWEEAEKLRHMVGKLVNGMDIPSGSIVKSDSLLPADSNDNNCRFVMYSADINSGNMLEWKTYIRLAIKTLENKTGPGISII